jgi:hypothetical protein
MPNDFTSQDRINELRNILRPNDRELGIIEISASGTRIAHGLKTTPKWVDCIPIVHLGVVATSWCYYQKPDANYLYIQASATGRFLVTVGG